MRGIIPVFLLVFLLLAGCGENAKKAEEAETNNQNWVDDSFEMAADLESETVSGMVAQNVKKHAVRNIDGDTFRASIDRHREYGIDGLIQACVIPHHLTAAPLIAGMLEQVSANADAYDTVVIIAPNHIGDLGDIILSRLDWDFGGGVACDTELVDKLMELDFDGVRIIENDERVEEDHSASALIPYIGYYFPEAKTAAVLVSRSLSLKGCLAFSEALGDIIKESRKNILVVCSVDFSHYLRPDEAMLKNDETIHAINDRDYERIHGMSNNYMDSPASLIIFLSYLSQIGAEPLIIDNTDASEFIGQGIEDTTSYLVIAGIAAY